MVLCPACQKPITYVNVHRLERNVQASNGERWWGYEQVEVVTDEYVCPLCDVTIEIPEDQDDLISWFDGSNLVEAI